MCCRGLRCLEAQVPSQFAATSEDGPRIGPAQVRVGLFTCVADKTLAVNALEVLRQLYQGLPADHPDRDGVRRSIGALTRPSEGMSPTQLCALLELLPPYLESTTTRCVSVRVVPMGVEVIIEAMSSSARTTYLLAWSDVLVEGDAAIEVRAANLSQAIFEHVGSGQAALFVWGRPGSHIR